MEKKKCIWCLSSEKKESFKTKAHTIPKSLGGQSFNKNVCDNCNSYFGSRVEYKYSIEEALKEGFNISRRMMLLSGKPKKKVGGFKSRYFDIRERNGKRTLKVLPSFRLNESFQKELCHAFKRGLYKLFLEELNLQKGLGFDDKYNVIREFSRYNKGDLPVIYFDRSVGIFMSIKREAETPVLLFDRMKYLYSNEKFVEIEFLGHVFGFPITDVTKEDFDSYITNSKELKLGHFNSWKKIDKLIDIDITLSIMDS